jgi:predicted O-linked N-acetylglucosamine transferase (SPINDLY family)
MSEVKLGRLEEAGTACRQALAIDPRSYMATLTLATIGAALGFNEQALDLFGKAISLSPEDGQAYILAGTLLNRMGRLQEALATFARASELPGQQSEAFVWLGDIEAALGRRADAIESYGKALALEPGNDFARAQRLHLLAWECRWPEIEEEKNLVPSLGMDGNPVSPFAMLVFEDSPERHKLRSEKFAAARYANIKTLPSGVRPATRPSKLRVGYFSSDFHDHPVFHCTARMFELHDRERFHITGYSFGPQRGGAMRERAAASFDEFKDVGHLGDERIAEIARSDQIDIAIDLNGYTEHQRIGIFARRPAPIQITYLGYPGTLGTSFIDYTIADRLVVPERHRDSLTERLIYLPHTYQATDNARPIPQPLSRSEAGLPEDGFVFCCFNSSYKLSRAAFAVWMELLKQVEGSVLWLASGSSAVEENLKRECSDHGVHPDRLIIAPRVDHAIFLQRLATADLFLDTFNYNAHGTASDALWAGLPIVTRTGEGFASRVATSLLNAVGLPELVAANEREYADIALSLADDPAKLKSVRSRLARNRMASPLFDSERFTRDMERGLDLAYQRYLQGREPADISV